MEIDERISDAVRRTKILRAPKHSLYTFGTSNIHYYLLTEPVYSELTGKVNETVIREGKVIAEKPKIVTPYYLAHLEGFSKEASKYFEALLSQYGPNVSGLLYTYKNESKGLSIVSNSLPTVAEKLNAEIDGRSDPLAAIIKGEDQLWDVSLLKFIFEITRSSIQDNVSQLNSRGLLDMDTAAGIPVEARMRIDELFRRVARGECEAGELKKELDRWGVFEKYEDRFYSLFQR